MNRRDFLRAGSLVSLGGIVAGPAALEWFERLTWKRTLFPGADIGPAVLRFASPADTRKALFNWYTGIQTTDPRYRAVLYEIKLPNYKSLVFSA